ncbi:unnamed protein product, partial [Cladocopium goreaui]
MPIRDEELGAAYFTTAIVRAGREDWRESLELWEQAKVHGFATDVITGSAVVAAASAAKQWHSCLGHLEAFRSSYMQLNAYGFNSAMTGCARADCWAVGLLTLNAMQLWQIETQVITFNAIAACLRPVGRWSAAIGCLDEACILNLQPNMVSYNTLLSQEQPWQNQFQLLERSLQRSLQSDAISWNSMVSSEAWFVALDLLQCLSRGIQLEVVAINAGSSSLASSSQWRQAVQLLSTACKGNIRVDATSHTAVSIACETSTQWSWALQTVSTSEGAIPWDEAMMGAAIAAWSGAHLWEASSSLLRLPTLQRDVVSFGSVLHACDHGGRWITALGWLRCMGIVGVRTNFVTDVAAMSACRTATQWRTASCLMGLQSNTVLFNALANACASSGQWRESLLVCSEAKQQSQLDDFAMSCAAACCPWQHATYLLRFDEESFQPGASMESFLGALIHSLCRAWQWRPAWEFMEKEAPRLQLEVDVVSLAEVVDACFRAGQLKLAAALLQSS